MPNPPAILVQRRGGAVLSDHLHAADVAAREVAPFDETPVQDHGGADPQPADEHQHVFLAARLTEEHLLARDGDRHGLHLHRQVQEFCEPCAQREGPPSQIGRIQDVAAHRVHMAGDHEKTAEQATASSEMPADQTPALPRHTADGHLRISDRLKPEIGTCNDPVLDDRRA